jgi:hypothetical protein
MSALTRVLLCGLVVVLVSGCASLTKPPPTRRTAGGAPVSRGRIDDPRRKHFACLQQHHVAASEPTPIEIQVGTPGVGPLIRFLPTPGIAQGAQMSGQVQGAEVIGSALLYPNSGTDAELKVVEACTALGVAG